jgi:pilus assembly protein CpaF
VAAVSARTGEVGAGVPALPEDAVAEAAEQVRARLARETAQLTPDVVAAALRAQGRPVGDATVLAVLDVLRRDVHGSGPLEPLLRLEGVTDVLVNGPDAVYVDRGAGLELTPVTFHDDAGVRRLAQRLAGAAGRRLDDASPYVDLRLADGTRLHAVLAPLARPGTSISLRVPRRRAFSLRELAEAGSWVPSSRRLLQRVVDRRLAFLISGGTGSGKTTLLNAMLGEVSASERLVLVEDTRELQPAHPHVVGLEARQANVEGAGAVDLRTLVRQALRMRPDRLVVGEVRGAEVVDLLAALNTGHEGGCGTIHANSAVDVPARVEGLALAAGLPSAAAHVQMNAGLDLVIHCTRHRDGRRGLGEIAVLEWSDGQARAVPAVRFTGTTPSFGLPGADRLVQLLEQGA